MLAGVRKRSALLCHRLQPPDAGQRGLATATFAKPALLSKIYAPMSKLDRSQGTETRGSVDYLIKAGFIRQVRSVQPSSRSRCRKCALAESDKCSRDAYGSRRLASTACCHLVSEFLKSLRRSSSTRCTLWVR